MSSFLDPFAAVQELIDALTNQERQVVLIRLAARLNNGKKHFDHGPNGYSWLCLACAQGEGMGPFLVTVSAMYGDPLTEDSDT